MTFQLSHVIAMAPPPQGADASSSMISTVLMFGSIIAIFYFMIIRPQKKRQDEQKKMLDAMKKGDRVVTSAGIHGTITDIEENVVSVQIADNVRIKIDKVAVTTVVQKN